MIGASGISRPAPCSLIPLETKHRFIQPIYIGFIQIILQHLSVSSSSHVPGDWRSPLRTLTMVLQLCSQPAVLYSTDTFLNGYRLRAKSYPTFQC